MNGNACPGQLKLRVLVIALVAVCVALGLPALARADAKTITFDDLTQTNPALQITNQYQVADNLLFGAPAEFSFQSGLTPSNNVVSTDVCGAPSLTTNVNTHSDGQAASLGTCGSSEFPNHGSMVALGEFSDSVSVYVGDPSGGTGDTFEIDAYDYAHSFIASAKTTTSVPGINNRLSVSAPPSAKIAYAAIYVLGQPTAAGIDDLSFSYTPGQQPQIGASVVNQNKAPITGLSVPEGGAATATVLIQRFNPPPGPVGPVRLSLTGLPAGVSAQWSPAAASTASGTTASAVTLTLSAPAAPSPSQAAVTLVATPLNSSAGTAPVQLSLAVAVVAPYAFVVPQPGSLNLASCGDGSLSSVALHIAGGETQPVTVTASVPRQRDITASVSPSTFVPRGNVLFNVNAHAGATDPQTDTTVTLTASSPGLPSETANVTVHRVGPVISSVNPFQGSFPGGFGAAPTAEIPGSAVTVDGVGFCPGSSVQFGNADAVVPANSVSPDGRTIGVRVPALATSGPLLVNTNSAGGSVTETPTSLQSGSFSVDSFRNENGFSFPNYNLSSFTFGQVAELVGPDSAYYSAPWGQYDNPNADWFLDLANDASAGGGVCFGIAASLQKFQSEGIAGGRFLDSFAPGNSGLAFFLTGSNGPAAALKDFIEVMHLDQFSSEFSSYQSAELDTGNTIDPNRTLHAVQQALANPGQFLNLPMIIIRNGSAGHALLAYDLEPDGVGGSFIDVYDPNRPFILGEDFDTSGATHQQRVQSSRIDVHPDGSWTFPGFSPAWNGNPYTMYPASWGTVPDPFSPNPNRRPSLPSVFSDLGGIFSGSSARTVQLHDAAGHSLYSANGQINTNPRTRIPHAVVVSDVNSSAASPPPLILVRTNQSYIQTLRDVSRGAWSQQFYGHGLRGILQSEASPGLTDKVAWNPGAGSVAFTTAASHVPLTVQLVASSRSGISRSAVLTTTTFARGRDTLTFGDSHNTLSYVHTGPATTVRLQLSTAGPGLTPTAFVSPRLRISSGDRLRFTPTRWTYLGNSPLRMTLLHAGRLSTRMLTGSLHIARARVLALSIIRGRSGSLSRLSVRALFPKLGGTEQAAVLFTVLGGHRTIARHSLLLDGTGTRSGARSLAFSAKLHTGHYRLRVSITLISDHGLIVAVSPTVTRSAGFTIR